MEIERNRLYIEISNTLNSFIIILTNIADIQYDKIIKRLFSEDILNSHKCIPKKIEITGIEQHNINDCVNSLFNCNVISNKSTRDWEKNNLEFSFSNCGTSISLTNIPNDLFKEIKTRLDNINFEPVKFLKGCKFHYEMTDYEDHYSLINKLFNITYDNILEPSKDLIDMKHDHENPEKNIDKVNTNNQTEYGHKSETQCEFELV